MSEGGSYDPHKVEPAIGALWDAGDYFHAEPDPRRKPFSIVIPPPNVTGALHLGHALNNTLQDILIRTKRMQGYNACWLPGTDHAGIATQAVVERRLREEEGLTRHEVGREGLVERIWKWKETYGNRILEQLRRMGCSCDWQRTRFTLDEVCARAVYETFFRMFKGGLIFRGLRLVNWDTQLQTAVADDEVYHEHVKGHLWHVRYPILPGAGNREQEADSSRVGTASRRPMSESGPGGVPALTPADIAAAIERATRPDAKLGRDYLMVATTRPETMLADTAVAVHPHDERYQHLIGCYVLLPLMNRPIPVIADGVLVDPKFGTGAVKVTPGHDPNDYACGQRHGLPMLNMMTPEGNVSEIGISDVGTQRRSDEGEREGTQARRHAGTKGGAGVSSQDQGGAGVSPADAGDAGAAPVFDYVGLSMDAARKQVVADLESLGLMDRIEPYETEVGHSDRSKTPIQPFLSEQWFVRMAKLAEMAMEAVRDQRVQFFPRRFAKTYLDWLSEKRDWCISRQLWWGHRIPVWTKSFDAATAMADILAALPGTGDTTAGHHEFGLRCDNDGRPLLAYQAARDGDTLTLHVCIAPNHQRELGQLLEAGGYTRDPDVLDTWFSSALWPFSTFGWPGSDIGRRDAGPTLIGRRDAGPALGQRDAGDGRHGGRPLQDVAPDSALRGPGSPRTAQDASTDLDYFYPTNVLSTARDIISLWVARMVMTSTYLNGRVPFQHVVIHPTILDGRGKRMSKTAGNGLDPLDLIQHYGTDAMRYSLAALAGDTQDVRIPIEYLCPHCGATTPQKPRHLGKPLVTCDGCKKAFATRIASADQIDEHGLGLSISERFEDGKRFCNKLWQVATGFVLPNIRHAGKERHEGTEARRHEGEEEGTEAQRHEGTKGGAGVSPADGGHSQGRAGVLPADAPLEDRWILSRLGACIAEVDRRREHYQFNEMINTLYAFFWNDFCDWYVEMVKPRLYDAAPVDASAAGGGDASAGAARRVLTTVLDTTLRLLHPVMPFITERLWQLLNEARQVDTQLLCITAWPTAADFPRDPEVEDEIHHTQDVIRTLRDIRAQINALRSQAKQKAIRSLPQAYVKADGQVAAQLQTHRPMLQRLGSAEAIEIGPNIEKPPNSASKVLSGLEVYVPLEGLADPRIERERLAKQRQQLEARLRGIAAKLANEKFVNHAPPEVVQNQRDRHAELTAQLDAINRNLSDLAG